MQIYDLVIPLGKGGQKNDDIELRYAIRSIEKYLRGYRNIFIVTWDRPAFLKLRNDIIETDRAGNETRHPGLNPGGYHWMAVKDVPDRKQMSMFNKLMAACENKDVSEEFVYWHDDHFLLKPLHVSEIKNWYEGTIEGHLDKAAGRYRQACQNTKRVLDMPYVGSTGYWKYFDIHTPCIFNKAGIRDLSKLDWDMEMIIKSLYFNMNKGESEYMKDCKINTPLGREHIEEKLSGRLFFSTGKNGLKEPMIEKFKELYPEPSKFEV